MSGCSSSPPFALFLFFNESEGEAGSLILLLDAVQGWQGLKKMFGLFTQYYTARKTCQHNVLVYKVFFSKQVGLHEEKLMSF